MKITFPGFPQEGMAFLRALKKNNDREWFTPRKHVFESTVRQHIAANHKQFRATFGTPKVKKLLGDLQGDSLSRVPKGFDPEHPAADLVKRKHYLLDTKLDPKLATTPKLFTELVARIEAMT